MERSAGLVVSKISPRGIGSKLGIAAGQKILSINGLDLRDEIDYRFLLTERVVRLRILDESGGLREVRIRKEWDEGLGLEFEGFPIRSCNNRCLFCFVDQMPPGLRRSLYHKDEDYRFSFLHGNYVTLTNLSEGDWSRVAEQRLSPLFISVHASDLGLRRFLLGNPKAPDILRQLRRLAAAHIQMHLQVVICPGLNDGLALEKTIQDLASLRPYAQSLSLVPVGLTDHRQGLFPLSLMSRTGAEEIVERSERLRAQFRRGGGDYFLHLADEIYLLAGRPFPPPRTYEGFPQLENGVGLSCRFLTEFRRRERSLPTSLPDPRSFLLLTGRLAFGVLGPVVDRLNEIRRLQVEAVPIPNSLFGSSVSVAGLLPGKDFRDFLREKGGGREVLIPESVLRDEGDAFLDDVRLPQLSRESGQSISPVNGVASLLRILLQPRSPKGA
ncbi:MAG: DUF512 domain-containing protein [bacterium]